MQTDFFFEVPVWVVVGQVAVDKVGISGSIMLLKTSDAGQAVVILTDEPQAEDLIKLMQWHGAVPHELPTWGALLDFLRGAAYVGHKTVALDPGKNQKVACATIEASIDYAQHSAFEKVDRKTQATSGDDDNV